MLGCSQEPQAASNVMLSDKKKKKKKKKKNNNKMMMMRMMMMMMMVMMMMMMLMMMMMTSDEVHLQAQAQASRPRQVSVKNKGTSKLTERTELETVAVLLPVM